MKVGVEVVRALRGEILRPGQAPDALRFRGDDASDTLHAAVLERGEAVAGASIMREPFPVRGGPDDWRVRGMATLPRARGSGIGSVLLQICIAHARDAGGTLLWCNARPRARSLYERAGLTAVGEVFEIAGIGPHLLMSMELRPPL